MLIWNLEIILRIIMKVKINIFFTDPPPILVLPVPIALERMLVKVLMLLGIGVLIILPIIILRWIRRPLLLLLVFRLLFSSFLLIVV
jgi:hypothetical protein